MTYTEQRLSSDKARAFFKYKAKQATKALREASDKAKRYEAYHLSPQHIEDLREAEFRAKVTEGHGCGCYCGACMD
jgi:hypothetical protein